MSLSYKEMQQVLMDELRLYHYPIAVKFFFDEAELETFKDKAEFYLPVKPMTFCQWEIAARMKGQTVLSGPEGLGCSNALVSFGWKEIDDNEIKSHAKYVRDLAQAERFVRSKPRLPEGLKAIAVGPLGDAVVDPSVVHFYCDNMQAYHLAVDYMAATDQHPLKTNVTMNSSACGGTVYSYQEKTANMLPACSGSYNAGKTERGEINFVIPGEHMGLTVERLLERKRNLGSGAITRPGDNFPGADICKNCPLIIFKKEK
ncbi:MULTISPECIES: DUF169 domain-containing protein [Nitratidesulfovibrio]|uniref:DUF169 domain-containing protein n=1 Tax=Nitratidesulfovibrio liaohensis TaxID=2604158 RepID=A0ABY9R137_9BACT|nr:MULTISPECIES: DUF169 domain-containing protein [Nitratidesulfovibrio]WMW64484.1 DUF169 domain-containing protein [Nitratidesulfovibrio liaohensis]